MSKSASFAARWVIGNPLYALSAAVMMYGIALVLNRTGRSPGELGHILSAYAALQFYEAALIALGAWILLRLLVPEDGVTLLFLEGLFLGGAFITLDELMAAKLSLGLGLAGVGLVLAAFKLRLASGRMRVQLDRPWPGLCLVLMALPMAWAPAMKAVVDSPASAGFTAYAAWMSLAGMLLAALLLAGLGVLRIEGGRAMAAPLVLIVITLLSAGAHLYSLHHAFLAPGEVWYPAPALTALAAAVVWAVFKYLPRDGVQDFVIGWLPAAPLLLYYVNRSAARGDWRELPVLLQPMTLGRCWLVALYVVLLLLTRRTVLIVPLAAAGVVAAGKRREVFLELASTHRAWCLVALAFGLLFLGGYLSAYKHRRRLCLANSALLTSG